MATLALPSVVVNSATPTWNTLRIGAGGFCTGLDVAPDGNKVIRTDTYGAYRWNGSQWVQLIRMDTMPAAQVGFASNGDLRGDQGVYEIVQAPSNSSILYMLFNNLVFVSTNAGASWTQTAFAQVSGNDPNGQTGVTRISGPHIAVDPQNPNFVVVVTVSNGVFFTKDGGNTWTSVASTAVPHATSIGMVCCFDPSSTVVGGFTQGIYVSSYGNGVYHSADGGATWARTSGGPTNHRHMICTSAGVLWMTADGGSQNLWKFAGGTWVNVNSGSQGSRGHSIAINGSNIYVGIDSGDLITSTDGGGTWTSPSFNNIRSSPPGDIGWLQNTNESYMSNGNMAWDTSTSRLYFAEGIGVWYSAGPAPSAMTWTAQSAGIEQLVGNMVLSTPAGDLLVTAGDRPVFHSDNPNTYPTNHGPNYAHAIIEGAHVCYAPASPSTVVLLANWGANDVSSISTDGGKTWTQFASYPPLASSGKNGGSMATKDGVTIVWFPMNNGQPYVSTNGGGAWSPISISGVPTTGETGWGTAYYLNRHIVCVDDAGTFFAYNNGASGNSGFAGVYRSTDGINWTRTKTGVFSSQGIDGFNAKLRAVPGQAGNLCYTGGDVGGSIAGSFWRSTDGGVTWVAVPNVVEVWGFGFGAPQTPGGYPSAYIAGWVGGSWGIWRSDNFNQATPTWTQIGAFPLNSTDEIKWVEGDLSIWNRCYVAFSGSGFAYFG